MLRRRLLRRIFAYKVSFKTHEIARRSFIPAQKIEAEMKNALTAALPHTSAEMCELYAILSACGHGRLLSPLQQSLIAFEHGSKLIPQQPGCVVPLRNGFDNLQQRHDISLRIDYIARLFFP